MATKVPTGLEIAEKSKNIRLYEDSRLHPEPADRETKVTFIPAKLHQFESLQEIEEGQVLGVLETDLEGDETNLPKGKYNIYLTKVDGDWQAYAEAHGKIAAKAARVSLQKHYLYECEMTKPTFHSKGWCFTYCLVGYCVGWGPFKKCWCLYSVKICF